VLGWVNFCWSNHPTDWGEWNSEFADLFRAELWKGFDRMTAPTQPPTVPTVDPYPVGTKTLNIVDSRYFEINLRDPDGSILAEIPDGATLTVIAPDTARMMIGGRWYDVQRIRYGAIEGVIALTTTFILEPVDDEAAHKAQLNKWADALQIIVDEMRAAAR
jgi:hypothetical protein